MLRFFASLLVSVSALALSGCIGVSYSPISIGNVKTTGILGSEKKVCAESCIEKLAVDGGEVCVKFSADISFICMGDFAGRQSKGTFAAATTLADSMAVVPVYFATDRTKEDDGSFGRTRRSTVTYGVVQVNIPLGHERGEIEQPGWISFRNEDPTKDVMVLSTTNSMSSKDFFSQLRDRIHSSPRKSLLLFVHGFRVSFEDAARRTAQMAYDLQFDGAPVFFSWPSQDLVWDYTVDEQSMVNAEPHLTQFLRDVLQHSDADSIYLIAHSMGNRGLTRALLELAQSDPQDVKRIKEVILAAPDIDATEFTEQIAPGLQKLGAPITLYVSSNDLALQKSKSLHGGDRAGQAGPKMVVLNGIETIDVSQLNTDFLGHSYYGDQTTVLADMHYLISSDTRASKRCCLKGQPSQTAPKYWVFIK